MKGQEKPKKVAKKPAQKTLKERRAAKRDASAKAPRGSTSEAVEAAGLGGSDLRHGVALRDMARVRGKNPCTFAKCL